MKSIKVFVLLAMLMALLAIALSVTPDHEFEETFFTEEDDNVFTNNETFDDGLPVASKVEEKTSLRGTSRFLASSHRAVTCDRNPKVCGGAAGAGSHHMSCCHKKCVDLKTDKLNCGKCGVKSHHSQICCIGHLVNPMSDKKHCGSCDNHCKKGSRCELGMCSYA